MDKSYFDHYELGARKKIREFNQVAHLFDTITDYPRNHYVDFSGTCKNNNLNIEVKDRKIDLLPDGTFKGFKKNGEVFICDDLYIEDHKVSDLMMDWVSMGLIPLYFNILQNGYYALYDLRKLSIRPKRYQHLNIESKGYQKMEFANRQGLYIKDAAIYDKDGKIIKKRGEEWKNDGC